MALQALNSGVNADIMAGGAHRTVCILMSCCCRVDPLVDRDGRDKAIVIVGMLADEVHSARSRSNKVGFGTEGF